MLWLNASERSRLPARQCTCTLALVLALMHSEAPHECKPGNDLTSIRRHDGSNSMTNLTERYVLRFPKGLREKLKEAATLYRRSVNSEILARLEQSLNGLPDQTFEDAIQPAFLEEIERMLRNGLTPDELKLLRYFKRLPADKRRALLDLLS
jgi:hypothetical protein